MIGACLLWMGGSASPSSSHPSSTWHHPCRNRRGRFATLRQGQTADNRIVSPVPAPPDNPAGVDDGAEFLRLPGLFRLAHHLSHQHARASPPPSQAASSPGNSPAMCAAASSGAGPPTASAAVSTRSASSDRRAFAIAHLPRRANGSAGCCAASASSMVPRSAPAWCGAPGSPNCTLRICKSTAASIFNWGRIISFFAPLDHGGYRKSFRSGGGDALRKCQHSLLAACIWLAQRETLYPRQRM